MYKNIKCNDKNCKNNVNGQFCKLNKIELIYKQDSILSCNNFKKNKLITNIDIETGDESFFNFNDLMKNINDIHKI